MKKIFGYVNDMFKSSLKPFYQLFIIHEAKNANHTSLLFFFINGTTIEISTTI